MASGYRRTYDQWRADPQAFWAEAARRISWTKPPEKVFDPDAGRLWPLVSRCAAERLLQRARPPCGSRPGRPAGALLRQPGQPVEADDLLSRASGRDGDARGRSRRPRRLGRRPRADLYADDPRGDRGDARLRPHRRGSLGRVRRLCGQGARDPHRRRGAQGRADGELRDRARPDRRIQAAARSRDRPRQAQAGRLRRLPAAADRGPDAGRAGTTTGRASSPPRRRRGSARPAPISPRPTRSISSTRPERPACRRGWCATSAAIWSRSTGRWTRSTT